MVKIINRRNKALGGQKWGRSESSITGIAWHYTAVARESRAFITGHENFWKNNRGWRRGGYHFYIDADANVYQNYDLTTISNGVAKHNSKIVNISVEANSASNYSKAQERARRDLTLYLMKRLGLPASAVKQHKEFSGQSTSCAGYSRAQMNAFRNELRGGKAPNIISGKSSTPSKPSTGGGSGGSIVDYLKSKGMGSGINDRKKLAKEYGINNYSGTASQNIQLLNKLKGGSKPTPAPKPTPKPTPTPKPSGKGNMSTVSIVEYLKSIGVKSDFNTRAGLARQYGVNNYSGTASQNTLLLSKMRSGSKPNKPTPKPANKGNMSTGSIVEYLKSVGRASDFNTRAGLAKQHGIKNYKGTASQNTQLLRKLRS